METGTTVIQACKAGAESMVCANNGRDPGGTAGAAGATGVAEIAGNQVGPGLTAADEAAAISTGWGDADATGAPTAAESGATAGAGTGATNQ